MGGPVEAIAAKALAAAVDFRLRDERRTASAWVVNGPAARVRQPKTGTQIRFAAVEATNPNEWAIVRMAESGRTGRAEKLQEQPVFRGFSLSGALRQNFSGRQGWSR